MKAMSRFATEVNVSKRILLVMFSALLGVLSFPPFSFTFLSILAWLPLLVAINGTSVRVATRLGVLHGLVFYGATLSWLTEVFYTMPYMIIPLVFTMAFFTGIFGLLVSYVYQLCNNAWWRPVLCGVLWAGVEFFSVRVVYS